MKEVRFESEFKRLHKMFPISVHTTNTSFYIGDRFKDVWIYLPTLCIRQIPGAAPVLSSTVIR